MTTKQRSKPLESPADRIKDKNIQKLSPTEKELLECHEKDQPVLLYGNDSIDLEELIERIKRVYPACVHNPDTGQDELIETEEFFKAIKVIRDISPLRYIDCGDMNGKEVYEALVGRSEFSSLEGGSLLKDYGDLIIDNLHCRLNNDEDDKYYRKLGKIIKERRIGHLPTKFNWLAAYTNDPEPFPTYFKGRFETILLDGELKESLKISRSIALKHIDKEPKAEAERQEAKVEKTLPKEEPKDEYAFYEQDDFYYIRYENESFRLRISDGLRYMHHLLKYPYAKKSTHNKFTPKQLYQEINKIVRSPDKDEKEAIEDDSTTYEKDDNDMYRDGTIETYNVLHDSFQFKSQKDYTEKVLDEESIELIKTQKRIKELELKKEMAKETRNHTKTAELKAQIDFLNQEYVKCIQRGGESFRFPSALHKKPYDVINNAINRALKKINEHSKNKGFESMLTWNHLSNSIQYKYSRFFYNPEKLPDWQL